MTRALSAFLITILLLSLGLSSCTVPRPPGAPPGPIPNNAFGATGTVRRHNPKDLCPNGDINYYLHMGGDLLVRLAVHGSSNDVRALERAIRTGEMVYVGGIRYPSPTPQCYYMLVNRVVPLGVMPEKKRPRAHMSTPETRVTTTTTVITPASAAPVMVVPVNADPAPVTAVPRSVASPPAPQPSIPGSINSAPAPVPGSGIPGFNSPATSSGVPGTIMKPPGSGL